MRLLNDMRSIKIYFTSPNHVIEQKVDRRDSKKIPHCPYNFLCYCAIDTVSLAKG